MICMVRCEQVAVRKASEPLALIFGRWRRPVTSGRVRVVVNENDR